MKTMARMLPAANAAEVANNHTTIIADGYLTTWLSGTYLHTLGPAQIPGQRASVAAEAVIVEQRPDLRPAPIEVAEQLQGFGRAPARQHLPAQLIAVGSGDSTVRVYPRARVARQHLAPQIGVIARRIVVVEDVAEVRGVVARRDRCVVNTRLLER